MKNVLSLFDGISCGQIAIKRAGIKIDNYFASEVDKHAIKVTNHNYPDTIQLGDIRYIDLKSLPKIDLLIGGSPCQSFSIAGKQKGMITKDNMEILNLKDYLKLKEANFEFEGQSYLFWEYIRILETLKPKYFLLENVVMNKKWEKVITEVLGVEPIKINSSLLSAQNRKRLYWTNIKGIEQPEDKKLFFKDIRQPLSTDYLWPEWRFKKFENKEYKYDMTYRVCSLGSKTRTLLTSCGKQTLKEHIDIKLTEKVSAIMKSSGSCHPKEFYRNTLRDLNCLELERLQTIPDNYTDCIPKTHRHDCIGNGWTVDVIAHILKKIKI